MGQIQTIEELIGFLLRRRWLIAIITVIGVILSVIVAKTQPDTFETAAVIQVQSAQVAGDAGAQTGSVQLLQAIEQRLTTRENMLTVIDRHRLFADTALTPDQKVALLRGAIRFEPVAAAGNQQFGAPASLSAIIIFTRLGEAEQAARVANDFAQSILDMSSAGMTERTRDTVVFFQDELATVEAQIAAVEAQVTAFMNQNASALPGLVQARQDELVAIDTDLREIDQQLVVLLGEQTALEARQSLRSTERRRLEDLLRQATVLTEQKTALSTRRDAIATAIAATPEVERQLAGFDRQMQQLQDQYQAITRRLAEAETGLKLAERQQGERFSLLERAITPAYPLGSGAKKIAIMGAVASFVGALGLAFLLDLIKPVVRSSVQMERQLGLRPVVVIPELDLPGRPRRGGGGGLTVLPDLRKQVQALPRFVVVAGAMTALLLVASAIV